MMAKKKLASLQQVFAVGRRSFGVDRVSFCSGAATRAVAVEPGGSCAQRGERASNVCQEGSLVEEEVLCHALAFLYPVSPPQRCAPCASCDSAIRFPPGDDAS